MPASKLPIADFRTQSQWHEYLGKLTPAQLKKVAAALNRILRVEFRLNTKKPTADLMEDIKKLYSVNNNTKLLEIVKGIDADELPQPSQNLPKPTKKQLEDADKKLMAQPAVLMEDQDPRIKKIKDEIAAVNSMIMQASTNKGTITKDKLMKSISKMRKNFKKLMAIYEPIYKEYVEVEALTPYYKLPKGASGFGMVAANLHDKRELKFKKYENAKAAMQLTYGATRNIDSLLRKYKIS